MALYYNISNVIDFCKGDQEEVQNYVLDLIFQFEKRLDKIEKNIQKKKYHKVLKHCVKMQSGIMSLELDEVLDLNYALQNWAFKSGNKTEGETIFFEYQKKILNTIKELKKDFKWDLKLQSLQ